jgi:hypothetical protein
LLEKVVEGGPFVVKAFRVTDLKALLLAHEDPQRGIDVKGDKAEVLERVMALANVNKSAAATDLDSSSARSQAQ